MKRKEKQRIRRFSALLLSLMLICAMSMTAFAADGSNTVAGETENTTAATETEGGQAVAASTHSYKAYQIFTGVYDPESKKLSNIDWGENAQNKEIQKAIAEALLGDKGANATLADILTALGGADTETANKLAAVIASNKDALGEGKPVQNGSSVDPGYYILIDETTNIGEGDSRGFALLQTLTGEITINEKRGTVSSDKKVKDVNDSNDGVNGAEGEWGTSADYDIDDDVPFVLTGTVADNFDMFEKYEFTFHDTMSSGLTFNNDISVTYQLKGNDKKIPIGSGYYTVDYSEENGTLQIKFDDLKAEGLGVEAGSVIEVSYTAKLNDGAVIGSEGNENTMYLEYSNDPYTGGKGETPKTNVIVFTYKVGINKVDQDNKPLEGAEFALYKIDKTYNGNDGEKNADGTMQNELNGEKYNKKVKIYKIDDTKTKFSFEGIDDGKYLLVETKTPAGYNSIEPIAFTVTVDHSTGDLSLKGESVDPTTGEVLLAFTADENLGTLTRDVVNKSGSLLPSTGGIGTTMFYIIGGVLMVGACMMLFVRKIMTNEKR